MAEIKWHVNVLDSAIMLNGTFVLPQRLADGANRDDVILGELLFRGSHGCSIRVEVYRQVLYQGLTLILSSGANISGISNEQTVCNPKNAKHVRYEFLANEKLSAHCHAIKLDISDRTMCHILYQDLNFHPYKYQIIQQLKNTNPIIKQQFCRQFLEILNGNYNYLNVSLLSDEVHFYLYKQRCVCKHVNNQSMRYLSQQNPCPCTVES
jgi:hypothetical protein